MSAPVYNILTQKEIVIDLSRPAMQMIIAALGECGGIWISGVTWTAELECEIDNFRNTLHNLLERSEPADTFDPNVTSEYPSAHNKPGNSDLIGD